MSQKLLLGLFPIIIFSSVLMSHSSFAENLNANANHPPDTSKIPNVKTVAETQKKASEKLVLLDAKLADKAAASTNQDVMNQASLVHKASGEAKQAAEDLAKAAQLLKPKKS